MQVSSVNTTTFEITTPSFNYGRPTTDANTSTRSGYYFDYVFSGEKSIAPPNVRLDTVQFGTVLPSSADSGSACTSGGSGKIYTLDVDTGNGNFRTSTVGLYGETLLLALPSGTTFSKPNSSGRGTKTLRDLAIDIGSGGAETRLLDGGDISYGRLSWRQINNYQDLKP